MPTAHALFKSTPKGGKHQLKVPIVGQLRSPGPIEKNLRSCFRLFMPHLHKLTRQLRQFGLALGLEPARYFRPHSENFQAPRIHGVTRWILRTLASHHGLRHFGGQALENPWNAWWPARADKGKIRPIQRPCRRGRCLLGGPLRLEAGHLRVIAPDLVDHRVLCSPVLKSMLPVAGSRVDALIA